MVTPALYRRAYLCNPIEADRLVVPVSLQYIHVRFTNRRKEFAYNLKCFLVNGVQVIGFEDLNTKGMMQHYSLGKRCGVVAWHQLIQ